MDPAIRALMAAAFGATALPFGGQTTNGIARFAATNGRTKQSERTGDAKMTDHQCPYVYEDGYRCPYTREGCEIHETEDHSEEYYRDRARRGLGNYYGR
jgi:hypothetical protein